MIGKFQILYNRTRQAVITGELVGTYNYVFRFFHTRGLNVANLYPQKSSLEPLPARTCRDLDAKRRLEQRTQSAEGGESIVLSYTCGLPICKSNVHRRKAFTSVLYHPHLPTCPSSARCAPLFCIQITDVYEEDVSSMKHHMILRWLSP
jgi:hypothetical protein